MCTTCFGFILLIWFPGLLHAQSAVQPCRAPRLVGGYFVPDEQIYAHETELTYACDEGLKPVAEGWWATSTCQNGKWSPQPQCIDENACIPITIPNSKYTENENGWYAQGATLRTTCDKGYEHKNRDATAKCVNGTWSSVPVCEKSRSTCSEPPKIPHAVIIHREYQEVFFADTAVQYECEDGYTVEGTHINKSIICMSGDWTEAPPCIIETGPGAGGGSAEVGTSDRDTSTGRGTQPGGGVRRPGAGGGSAEVGTGSRDTSTGRGTQPGAGGSSTSSGSGPSFITIDNCGTYPTVPNGVVVQEDRMYLKYKCNSFYTQVGLDTVVCQSDGTWSQPPTCKEAFCVMSPGRYDTGLTLHTSEYIKEGETKNLQCIWRDYTLAVQCSNGKITRTRCKYVCKLFVF
ncbi:complement factor H-like isoform X2 [Toxotes jaculatrix]|uniref:complement factor H-like isoform X2 n=1 Tax=Toxotes jaculatrix TaxID=941984 RepID=UPI001B3AF193|nr:complement factor H-like isoform X2 [Toxotes jaculatrix]